MALVMPILDPFGVDTLNNAYIRIDKPVRDSFRESGTIEISVWKNKAARNTWKTEGRKAQRLGNILVGIGAAEVLQGAVVIQLAWIDVNDKTMNQLYLLMKTKTVLFEGQTLDLSTAIDD
jgi:hypothetical protein